jgi:magnesium transporter
MGRHRRRRTKPGSSPGTITVDPDAPRPSIRVVAYGPEGCREEPVVDPGRLREWLGRWPVVWVNVDGLGDAQVIERLAEVFGLHRLALEDVVNIGQRAKTESFDEHLFVIMRMAEPAAHGRSDQLSLFLGKNYVLTFQERAGDCFEPVRLRLRAGQGRLSRAGPDYLAYALIDAVVDSYFPVLEPLGARLAQIEDQVFSCPERRTMSAIQEVKSELRELRRAAWPHRDLMHALLRADTIWIQETTRVYLRDCADHAAEVMDLIENDREIATDLTAAYLSSMSNRLNEVMKLLTIVTAVFIPLSFIAGVYGMNFDPEASPWNMPELRWALGYPAALLLMAVVAAGMLVFFWKRRWFD